MHVNSHHIIGTIKDIKRFDKVVRLDVITEVEHGSKTVKMTHTCVGFNDMIGKLAKYNIGDDIDLEGEPGINRYKEKFYHQVVISNIVDTDLEEESPL